MKKNILIVIFMFSLLTPANALEIRQKEFLTINPGEFQIFTVEIINNENEEREILFYLQNPKDTLCYFENYNLIDVLKFKPLETKSVLINIYASINISSQNSACMFNYVIGLDEKNLEMMKRISNSSEIIINNYTIEIGKIHPIYVAVRGNVTIPTYYTPSKIEETLNFYKFGFYSLIIIEIFSILVLIKKRKRK